MKRRQPQRTTEARTAAPASANPGVVVSLDELVGLRSASRRIDLGRPGRVASRLSGPHRSPFRGRGMEFAEVRAYAPGDEVRHIDWRVTARTGRPHSKLFEEERERPVIVLADARATMHFGTRQCFKSVAATRWAALLAWAAVERGDRVGGVALSGSGGRVMKLRRDRTATTALMSALAEASAAPAAEPERALSSALQDVRRMACVGAEIYILSDFADLDTEASRHLAHLARYAHTTCLFVHDPLEAQAPADGLYRVSNGARVASLSIGNTASRSAWVSRFDTRSAELEKLCSENGATLGFLSTANPSLGFMPSTAKITAVPMRGSSDIGDDR
jgi:uncharacterized protein (DUF58 family)